MSRSGYTGDCDNFNLYRATVDRAIHGKRGQTFLQELAAALDAMPEKALIAGELVSDMGEVCAIGSVCKARAMDVNHIDCENPNSVARAIGIATSMAAEIAYMNDEYFDCVHKSETPQQRWKRMRQWVTDNTGLKETP